MLVSKEYRFILEQQGSHRAGPLEHGLFSVSTVWYRKRVFSSL